MKWKVRESDEQVFFRGRELLSGCSQMSNKCLEKAPVHLFEKCRIGNAQALAHRRRCELVCCKKRAMRHFARGKEQRYIRTHTARKGVSTIESEREGGGGTEVKKEDRSMLQLSAVAVGLRRNSASDARGKDDARSSTL